MIQISLVFYTNAFNTLWSSVVSWLGRLSLWHSLQMAQKFIWALCDDRDVWASICNCSLRWRVLNLARDIRCCNEIFSSDFAWRGEERWTMYSYIFFKTRFINIEKQTEKLLRDITLNVIDRWLQWGHCNLMKCSGNSFDVPFLFGDRSVCGKYSNYLKTYTNINQMDNLLQIFFPFPPF